MANNNQIVRKSLLKSSISLKTINKSVSFLSKDLKRSTNLILNTNKVTNEDNKFKRSLIGKENTWFNRRREQVLRREKEDITEAATVGGAIKRRGKVLGASTKGFLGRILDVFGILFIGWLVTNLPKILNVANSMSKLIQSAVSILGGFLNNTIGILTSLGGGLSEILTKTIDVGKPEKETESIKKGFDDMQRGASMFSSDVDRSIQTYLDPATYGLTSWDDPEMEEEEEDLEDDKTDKDEEPSEIKEETEKPQEKVEVKVEPKENLVMGGPDKKPNDSDALMMDTPEDDPAIANNPNINLEDRFNNGYIPQRMINGKENPDYAEYKEWLNAPGGLEMFKDGGIIKGKSHAEGGENINVEGGEAVIPKKSVDKLGPEFINRIIEGNANKITKLRAGRSLLEKLVEQHKEENDGLITYDEYKELKAATVGKLKEHLRSLNFDSTKKQPEQITPKKQEKPKVDVQKSKINKISYNGMKKKRKIVTVPIPNTQQSQMPPMSPPPSGASLKTPHTMTSGGLTIGDIQSLMLSYT